MPSTVTHGYFAKDIFKKLKNKRYVDLEYLKTFSQGPDVLFFYNSINLKKGKDIRKLARVVHNNNTQDFFYNLIKYIVDNNLKYNKKVISFLYGFILHYSLDSEVHPYVFYKTGTYDKIKKETIKYKSLHQDIEKAIDIYMLDKNNIKPKKFKLHKEYFNVDKFDKDLNNLIDYAFLNTYNKNNISKIYYISIKMMKISYYIMRYDPHSIKKYIYKFIYKIFPFLSFNIELLSYSDDYKSKIHYLNLNNNIWNHPCIKEETYNYSFDNLYDIALAKALKLIEETNKIIYDKKDLEYTRKIFKNISYLTGKDCNLKLKLKYFEF